jgi:hypothetical protein
MSEVTHGASGRSADGANAGPGESLDNVRRELLAAAYPEMDEQWVDGNVGSAADDARALDRRLRSRRRREEILRLSRTDRLVAAAFRMVFLLVTLAALILGYLGVSALLEGTGQATGPLDVLYYDLQLFVLGADPLASGGRIPLALQIARFAAPAVTIYALVETLRILFTPQIRKLRIRRSAGHVVICGGTALAQAIAARETMSGARVVLVQTAQQPPYPDVQLMVGDPRDPRDLTRAGVRRASRLYAVDADAAANVAMALGAAAVRRSAAPLDVYASVPDPALCQALNARQLAAPSSGVGFFNVEELAARRLAAVEIDELAEHPDGHIVVAGMSTFGQELILELARRWAATVSGYRMRVTVVDKAATEILSRLGHRLPRLRDICEFTAHDTGDLVDLVASTVPLPDLIRTYICDADESRALRAAFAATRLWRGPNSVVVRLDTFAAYGADFADDSTSALDHVSSSVLPFGVLDVAADLDLLAESPVERVAWARYVQRSAESEHPARDWAQLPHETRRALRATEADIVWSLYQTGCIVIPAEAADRPAVEFSVAEVEQLAKAEHERWVSERRTEGWIFGSTRDLELRTHPDLVLWEELPERRRDAVRQSIRETPDVLAWAGFRILRMLPDRF